MKIILTIFCSLMILLTGGCALVIGNEMGLISLVLLGIAALNALLIAAMYGISGPMRPAFMTLMVADVVVALILLGAGFTYTNSATGELQMAVLLAAAFLVKGGLTYAVSQQLGRS